MKNRIYIGDRKSREKENKRVRKFFFAQLKKDWNVEEALEQVSNNYGLFFKECLIWDLQQYYKRKKEV